MGTAEHGRVIAHVLLVATLAVAVAVIVGASPASQATSTSRDSTMASPNQHGLKRLRAVVDPPRWLVAPGRVGPFRVGMSVQRAVDTGEAERTPDDTCGSPVGLVRTLLDPELGGYAMYWEWRFGPSRDDLDGVTIKSPWFKTAKGIGVGSSMAQLTKAYPKSLKTVRYDPVLERDLISVPALFSRAGALVFHLDTSGHVRSMQVLRGRPGQTLINIALGC